MADAAFLIASIDRPVRFLMFRGSYEHPLVKPFAKILGVIPIASDQGPREMIHSLRQATEALKNGEVVCIFPEGQMTRIGQMMPFRRGMERIIKGVDVPIIPVNLDGVWGSIFSFAGGRFLWEATAIHHNFAGSAPRGSRPERGSFRTPQEAHAHLARILRLHRAKAPFPVCHGRWTKTQAELLLRAGGRFGPLSAHAQALAGPGNDWRVFAPIGSRRSGELCGHADGQSAGESELHGFE
jgi:hypothetical protein